MTRDEGGKVTFYADADVKEKLDQLDPGTKSHTINKLLRKGFEGGATMTEQIEVLNARTRKLESEIRRNGLFDKELHNFCSEFYSVEKSIQVVVSRGGTQMTVKIDALRDEENGKYSIAAYYQEHVTMQPTYPQSYGKFDQKPDDFIAWVNWIDFPWVHADSAEGALRQALGFLRDRCDDKARI